MAAEHTIIPELENAPYKREFQDFVMHYAAAATGKPIPPPDFVRNLERERSTFVTAGDMRDIIDKITNIMKRDGFMPYWELENQLITEISGKTPDPDAVMLSDHIADMTKAPDPLTGFMQKSHVPLTTAMAWLYAEKTGNPAHIIEIDFSNMRGTNEHFEKLLKAANNESDDVSDAAMALTDKAAYIMSQRMIAHMQKKGVNFIALRSGGDEARLVITGQDDAQINQLINELHGELENVTARMGLHDHPHAKAPKNPVKRGFGAAMAPIRLNGLQNLGLAVKEADEQIKTEKENLGRERLTGRFDSLKPAGNASPNHVISDVFTSYGLPQTPTTWHRYLEDFIDPNDTDKFMSIDQLKDHLFDSFDKALSDHGTVLSDTEKRLFKTKIKHYPAIDYASGTMMPRDMPAITSFFAEVTRRKQDKILNGPYASLEEQQDARNLKIHGIGISMHNLSGLNDKLGHEGANAFLYHASQAVIAAALNKQGIDDEHFQLAHYGGGEFRAVIQPIKEENGKTSFIRDDDIKKVLAQIEEEVEALNEQKLAPFLAR